MFFVGTLFAAHLLYVPGCCLSFSSPHTFISAFAYFFSSLNYRNLITKLVVEPCLLPGAAVVVDNSVQFYHHIHGFLCLSVFLPLFTLSFSTYAMLKLEELS